MCEELRPPKITKPLLTIAIPTYGRAKYLKELLSVLADQLKDEPHVELIISDNASPDETRLVVQDFVDGGLRVRYICNAENVGSDANFLQCFEQARGKYFWLFSDDDLIVPGALARILAYCQAAEYDLIWVSSYSFEGFFQPRALKARKDAIEIADARTYAKQLHVFFTYISGNIINKDKVVGSQSTAFSSLIGTGLVQLGWTYTALNGFTRGLYIREKLIAARANNTGGYKLFQVFGSTLAMITNAWLMPRSLGRIVINGTLQRFWPLWLLAYKKRGRDFTDVARPQTALTPVFGDNFRYWVFAYPVMVLPSVFAAVWVLAARVLNRLDKALGFPMLDSRDESDGS